MRFLRPQSSSGLGRTIHYSARYRLGTTSVRPRPFITMRGAASVPLGPSITVCGAASVPLQCGSGPLSQCAAPLGPSFTMRGAASVPLGPSTTMRGTASVPLRYRSGPPLQCAVPTPRLHFTKFYLGPSEELPRKHKDQQNPRGATLTL